MWVCVCLFLLRVSLCVRVYERICWLVCSFVRVDVHDVCMRDYVRLHACVRVSSCVRVCMRVMNVAMQIGIFFGWTHSLFLTDS